MSPDSLRDICGVLKQKYPQVFRQATFTTGIRSETAETMERLATYSRQVGLDFAAYHPLQPYPGTPLWDQASREGWIEEEDFSNFDMFYPVMSSEHLPRTEIAQLTSKITKDFVTKQPLRYFLSLFSIHPMRRRLHWWFLFSIGRVMFHDVLGALMGTKRFEGFSGVNQLKKPGWYDD
jgi:anaerobic magnesium-protoporphyrin IX monomethyl ester cyclase